MSNQEIRKIRERISQFYSQEMSRHLIHTQATLKNFFKIAIVFHPVEFD